MIDVPTILSAEQHIVASPRFAQLPVRAGLWTQAGHVLAELQAAEVAYNAGLGNGGCSRPTDAARASANEKLTGRRCTSTSSRCTPSAR